MPISKGRSVILRGRYLPEIDGAFLKIQQIFEDLKKCPKIEAPTERSREAGYCPLERGATEETKRLGIYSASTN